MGTGYNPRIVTDGLVLSLDPANKRSYSGSGSSMVDLSKNNNATLYNSPTFSAANAGKFIFDGTDDYLTTDTEKSDFTEISICVWFKLNALTNVCGVLQFGDGMTTGVPWILLRTTGSASVRWYFRQGYRITVYSDDIATTPQFLCLTFDGSTTWKAYLNGQYYDQYTTDVGSYSGSNFWVGTGYNGRTNMDFYGCNLYDKALTADEIRQNYLATKERYA